ncbi:MAG: hypothetical protein GY882_03995 [Actinomycetia bacterium]|nr:hypothetical protein [Actinomycetes bacterium]MCP4843692.1 hypothetical protein [Actinomycetes bacterium]
MSTTIDPAYLEKKWAADRGETICDDEARRRASSRSGGHPSRPRTSHA